MKFPALSIISRIALLGFVGLVISGCNSTMEGIGKDLQTMGNAMGGSSTSQQNNQSQTQGKDVVITPVK
jgi:predicted small secreted protein